MMTVAWRVFLAGGGWARLASEAVHDHEMGLAASRGGHWPVWDLLDVRRPEVRHGRQLEVLIRWKGRENSGVTRVKPSPDG